MATLPGVTEHAPDGPVPDGAVPDGADLSLSLRPPRRAFLLAYLGVVVAGLLGGAIGAGLVDSMCRGDCGGNVAAGGLAGAAVAAGGVAVVAVLVLRAMHEWNEYQARQPPVPQAFAESDLTPEAQSNKSSEDQPNDSRRNPSA